LHFDFIALSNPARFPSHFHYGYHVYAAAVVAAHDPTWAAESFDTILLYIRDFANPVEDDPFFPPYRQKDWFLGSSWAAGIVSAENSPHGRNQESSSEAIAAYEAVALYGTTMVKVFENSGRDTTDFLRAKAVQNAGQLLTLTEVRAANRYWHVWESESHANIYPPEYKRLVVGMLYETMASFQTWFGPDAIFSYGIQLIPLTPIGEYRDDPVWASELYPEYAKSCKDAGKLCTDNGWSVPQAGLLATIGNRDEAVQQALELPTQVFENEGAVGNSLTNTLWYIATRKPFTVSNSTSSNTTAI
jgi:endoglucanase Acf2